MLELRLILAVAALAGALVGGWSLDRAAYKRGVAAVEARYAARDAEAARQAAQRVDELQAQARAAEQAAAARLAAVSTDYQRRLASAATENDRMRRALAAGDVRLRFPRTEPAADGPRGAAAETGAAAAGCHGPEAGQLPRAVALDLWQLAADADAVAEQLAACQAVLRGDRGG